MHYLWELGGPKVHTEGFRETVEYTTEGLPWKALDYKHNSLDIVPSLK